MAEIIGGMDGDTPAEIDQIGIGEDVEEMPASAADVNDLIQSASVLQCSFNTDHLNACLTALADSLTRQGKQMVDDKLDFQRQLSLQEQASVDRCAALEEKHAEAQQAAEEWRVNARVNQTEQQSLVATVGELNSKLVDLENKVSALENAEPTVFEVEVDTSGGDESAPPPVVQTFDDSNITEWLGAVQEKIQKLTEKYTQEQAEGVETMQVLEERVKMVEAGQQKLETQILEDEARIEEERLHQEESDNR
jgi:hypothetical protein